MTYPLPPSHRFNEYVLKGNYVFWEGSKGDVLVMTGLVWIAEPVICPETGHMSWLIEVQPIVGERRILLVRPEDLNAKYLKKVLGQCGIIIHSDAKVPHYLSMTGSFGDCLTKPVRTLIQNPGWFANGRGFFTGRKVIAAECVTQSQFRFEPVDRAPIAEQGTLDGWKENIGTLVQRNPVLLTVACLFIASPFLRLMGLSTRLVNIYGAKGTGKTISAQVGATVWGNGIDPAAGMYSEDPAYATKFSTTVNGIELLLARYSPMPMALDEMTEQAAEMLGELLYKMASGQGKTRMSANMRAAPPNKWLLTIVSTSEKSVADAVKAGGKPLLGGQQDRAIDLPIDRIGVLSDCGDFPDFQAVTRHLKKACGEHYGSAGRAILQFACNYPEKIAAVIATSMPIEERLMPLNCGDGERRVVKFMAAAVVAGHIAIEAGVFDCSRAAVEAAVKQMVMEWWHGRGGSLRRIAEFLHANTAAIKFESPTFRSSAKVFIDGNNIIIPDHVFDSEFGDDAKAIVADLMGLNALVREQNNRNKHRFCNNRLYAYVIKFDRVEPILQELGDRDNDNDKDMSGDSGSQLDEAM